MNPASMLPARTARPRVLAMVAATLLSVATQPARAQFGMWRADSLLAEGLIARAEAAYYAAVRYRPRDAAARAALGRYLAARGAERVGAVLLEEARDFGADSSYIAGALAPLYARVGDYAALAALRPIVHSAAEQRRAEWLRDHAPSVEMRDSVVVLTYRPATGNEGIGTVMLQLGGAEFPVRIDPGVSGLVVPQSLVGDDALRVFGDDARGTVAVASQVRMGPVMFTNLPVVVEREAAPVRLGFGVLGPYSPTFDPGKGILTLRLPQRRSRPLPGPRIPALFDSNGMRLLLAGRWQSTNMTLPARLLRERAWTWDPRRGDVVLQP